jgi:hypothetical protein
MCAFIVCVTACWYAYMRSRMRNVYVFTVAQSRNYIRIQIKCKILMLLLDQNSTLLTLAHGAMMCYWFPRKVSGTYLCYMYLKIHKLFLETGIASIPTSQSQFRIIALNLLESQLHHWKGRKNLV